jgi:hypothetical protein
MKYRTRTDYMDRQKALMWEPIASRILRRKDTAFQNSRP